MSNKDFHIVAVRREPPDLERFVAALLALTMNRLEEERKAEADAEETDDD